MSPQATVPSRDHNGPIKIRPETDPKKALWALVQGMKQHDSMDVLGAGTAIIPTWDVIAGLFAEREYRLQEPKFMLWSQGDLSLKVSVKFTKAAAAAHMQRAMRFMTPAATEATDAPKTTITIFGIDFEKGPDALMTAAEISTGISHGGGTVTWIITRGEGIRMHDMVGTITRTPTDRATRDMLEQIGERIAAENLNAGIRRPQPVAAPQTPVLVEVSGETAEDTTPAQILVVEASGETAEEAAPAAVEGKVRKTGRAKTNASA